MIATIISFVIFIIYTILVKFVGVGAIGPDGSEVGFAGVNGWFHNLTGENFGIYNMTDVVSLVVAGAVVLAFAILGLVQLVKRKSLKKVDADILALGIFYILVGVAYVVFEVVKINYRPVLIDGALETSYPSSTTMLAITVFGSAMAVIPKYVKGRWGRILEAAAGVMLGFLVVLRTLSGVHWLTDIIGGILLSVALISAFFTIRKFLKKTLKNR